MATQEQQAANKGLAGQVAVIASNLRTEIDDAMKDARTLRDEIRVKIHLGEMDAKDAWKRLEPSLADAEKLAGDVSETTRKAAVNVAKSFRDFRDSIQRRNAERHR